MAKEKLSICFIGHVDSGKSTTIGRLSYDLGALDPRKLEKLKKEADLKGKGSFSFAFFTDRNEAERDRGITITTTLVKLETDKFNLNVIDCPGHKDFIKNMVSGTAQADVAVVIVPSAPSEFESALQSGTLKDHIMISGVLGVKKVIIAVNKVDVLPTPEAQFERYTNVAEEMVRVVKKLHPDKTPVVIPISGLMGTNMTKKGPKFEWFKGWTNKKDEAPVFSLEEALDYQTPPERPIDKPLRASINAIMKVPGVGSVLTAQVLHGQLTVGTQITIQPSDIVAEIKTLEIHKEACKTVFAGDNFGCVIKVTKGDLKNVKAGFVISNIKDNPVKLYKGARARIVVIEHPKGVKAGYCPVLDLGVIHVPCKIFKILSKKSKDIKEEIQSPDIVTKGESMVAIIIPQKDCVMEVMTQVPALARFALRDGGKVVGVGAIDMVYDTTQLKEFGYATEEGEKEKGKGKGKGGKGQAAAAA